jgi:hypothetical protein
MPNVKSILNDIEKLPLHQKEQILSTLEEILVLGSQVRQVEQEVKNLDFLRGKYARFVALKLYQEMVSMMINKDISANLVKRPLLTSLILQPIKVRKH